MQLKRIHIDSKVWTYHVGRSFVRITSPQGRSWAVRKADVLEAGKLEARAVETWVPAPFVRAYIRRHLLYYRKRIFPERGASVLLKRALLKL